MSQHVDDNAVHLAEQLGDIVGADHVLTDPDITAAYGTDWTRHWSARPLLVVRPEGTDEVARVVAACARLGVPVIPQGGNTGLVGGGVPRSDDSAVVLSTRRLTELGDVDEATQTVVAGAGVTLADLEAHAHRHGLRYAVDLAARDSATLGGTVATNAGGLRVVGLGDTRRQIAGVEAVLADGSVVSRLAPLAKDNGGYDLSQLMIGSEGTLGVVTAVRVRLLPALQQPAVVTLVGCTSIAAAVELVAKARVRGDVSGAELIRAEGMRVVRDVCGLSHPLQREWPVYLLLETTELPVLDDSLDAAVDPRLWEYRDRQAEAVATLGVPHKLDVCLALDTIAAFVDRLDGLPAMHGRDVHLYAHIGDGNLHINVVDVDDTRAMDDEVLGLVAEFGGSIAAEHGVGVAKRDYLHLSRSVAEISAMRAVKHALDPHGVMNPGVLLP